MDDASEMIESIAQTDGPVIPPEPLPPIQSRFLFVGVAALRAKQLRRGAQIRFDRESAVPPPIKPERVAMEEVRRGLVYYNVPPLKAKFSDIDDQA